ncbi:MAG: PepSY domain-containing protein [Bacteroidetes bacterium]|nr:PepSY domain-containing protein [Bacteroidota bacterium]
MKQIYKWHRKISIIIAIPVILWAASGFMHPIMTSFRPKMATQVLQPLAIDTHQIKLSLTEALQNNKIDSFTNFRFVHIDTNWFYQVQRGKNIEPIYLSTKTGKILRKGDWIYAQYLGKQFLEGQTNRSGKKDSTIAGVAAMQDCCDAAAVCVLKNSIGAKVSEAKLVTSFNDEYKSVNKILPVWEVAFDRKDGIRIYVETTQDRFALAMDNQRAIFNQLFALIHTWGWLAFLGKGKLVVEITLNILALMTVVFGLIIFFKTKSKKANGNTVVKARKTHRITSICIAFFTLAFVFSGGYHAASKFKKNTCADYFDQHWFTTANTIIDLKGIQWALKLPISNISLVHMKNGDFYQVNTISLHGNNSKPVAKDMMKKMAMPVPTTIYLHLPDLAILKQGETMYAHYLANQFSGNSENDILKTEVINKFAGEYGFINKLLPVTKVGYGKNLNERYYVETASGKLSVKINDLEMLEGYSFAFLHKHEFLTPLGKAVKDFSTMFWAAAQIALVTVGLMLFFKVQQRKKRVE